MPRFEKVLIKPSYSKLKSNLIDRISKKHSARRKEILRLVTKQDYSSFISISLAEKLTREINEFASYNGQTQEFVEEIRKKLFLLHEYNSHVAKVTYSYPTSKELYELLGRYVALESDVFYKKRHSFKYEKKLENRVFLTIYSFINDSFSIECNYLNDERKHVYNEALKIFVSYVDVKYTHDEDKFPARIVKNILDKLGLIKKSSDDPNGHLDLNNPSLIKLKESLKDSDYGSDDDGQETASISSESSFMTLLSRTQQTELGKDISNDDVDIYNTNSSNLLDESTNSKVCSQLSNDVLREEPIISENAAIEPTQSSSIGVDSTNETYGQKLLRIWNENFNDDSKDQSTNAAVPLSDSSDSNLSLKNLGNSLRDQPIISENVINDSSHNSKDSSHQIRSDLKSLCISYDDIVNVENTNSSDSLNSNSFSQYLKDIRSEEPIISENGTNESSQSSSSHSQSANQISSDLKSMCNQKNISNYNLDVYNNSSTVLLNDSSNFKSSSQFSEEIVREKAIIPKNVTNGYSSIDSQSDHQKEPMLSGKETNESYEKFLTDSANQISSDLKKSCTPKDISYDDMVVLTNAAVSHNHHSNSNSYLPGSMKRNISVNANPSKDGQSSNHVISDLKSFCNSTGRFKPNFPTSNEVFSSISKGDIQTFIDINVDDDIEVIRWSTMKSKFPQPHLENIKNCSVSKSKMGRLGDKRNMEYRIYDTISIISSDGEEEDEDFEDNSTDFDAIEKRLKEQKLKQGLLSNLRNELVRDTNYIDINRSDGIISSSGKLSSVCSGTAVFPKEEIINENSVWNITRSENPKKIHIRKSPERTEYNATKQRDFCSTNADIVINISSSDEDEQTDKNPRKKVSTNNHLDMSDRIQELSILPLNNEDNSIHQKQQRTSNSSDRFEVSESTSLVQCADGLRGVKNSVELEKRNSSHIMGKIYCRSLDELKTNENLRKSSADSHLSSVGTRSNPSSIVTEESEGFVQSSTGENTPTQTIFVDLCSPEKQVKNNSPHQEQRKKYITSNNMREYSNPIESLLQRITNKNESSNQVPNNDNFEKLNVEGNKSLSDCEEATEEIIEGTLTDHSKISSNRFISVSNPPELKKPSSKNSILEIITSTKSNLVAKVNEFQREAIKRSMLDKNSTFGFSEVKLIDKVPEIETSLHHNNKVNSEKPEKSEVQNIFSWDDHFDSTQVALSSSSRVDTLMSKSEKSKDVNKIFESGSISITPSEVLSTSGDIQNNNKRIPENQTEISSSNSAGVNILVNSVYVSDNHEDRSFEENSLKSKIVFTSSDADNILIYKNQQETVVSTKNETSLGNEDVLVDNIKDTNLNESELESSSQLLQIDYNKIEMYKNQLLFEKDVALSLAEKEVISKAIVPYQEVHHISSNDKYLNERRKKNTLETEGHVEVLNHVEVELSSHVITESLNVNKELVTKDSQFQYSDEITPKNTEKRTEILHCNQSSELMFESAKSQVKVLEEIYPDKNQISQFIENSEQPIELLNSKSLNICPEQKVENHESEFEMLDQQLILENVPSTNGVVVKFCEKQFENDPNSSFLERSTSLKEDCNQPTEVSESNEQNYEKQKVPETIGSHEKCSDRNDADLYSSIEITSRMDSIGDSTKSCIHPSPFDIVEKPEIQGLASNASKESVSISELNKSKFEEDISLEKNGNSNELDEGLFKGEGTEYSAISSSTMTEINRFSDNTKKFISHEYDDECTSYIIDESEIEENEVESGERNNTPASKIKILEDTIIVAENPSINNSDKSEVATSDIDSSNREEASTSIHSDTSSIISVEVYKEECIKNIPSTEVQLPDSVSPSNIHLHDCIETNITEKQVDVPSNALLHKAEGVDFTPKVPKSRCSDSHNVVGNLGKVMQLMSNNEPRRPKRNISFTSPIKMNESCASFDTGPVANNLVMDNIGTRDVKYNSYSTDMENNCTPLSSVLGDTTFSQSDQNSLFTPNKFYSSFISKDSREKEILFKIEECDSQKQQLDIDILASVASNQKPLEVDIKQIDKKSEVNLSSSPKTQKTILNKLNEGSNETSSHLKIKPFHCDSPLENSFYSNVSLNKSPSRKKTRNSKANYKSSKADNKKDFPDVISDTSRKTRVTKSKDVKLEELEPKQREGHKCNKKIVKGRAKNKSKGIKLPDESFRIHRERFEKKLVTDDFDSDDSLPLNVRMKKIEISPEKNTDIKKRKKGAIQKNFSQNRFSKNKEKAKNKQTNVKKKTEEEISHQCKKENELETKQQIILNKPDKNDVTTSQGKEDRTRRIVHFKKAMLELISQDLDETIERNSNRHESKENRQNYISGDKNNEKLLGTSINTNCEETDHDSSTIAIPDVNNIESPLQNNNPRVIVENKEDTNNQDNSSAQEETSKTSDFSKSISSDMPNDSQMVEPQSSSGNDSDHSGKESMNILPLCDENNKGSMKTDDAISLVDLERNSIPVPEIINAFSDSVSSTEASELTITEDILDKGIDNEKSILEEACNVEKIDMGDACVMRKHDKKEQASIKKVDKSRQMKKIKLKNIIDRPISNEKERDVTESPLKSPEKLIQEETPMNKSEDLESLELLNTVNHMPYQAIANQNKLTEKVITALGSSKSLNMKISLAIPVDQVSKSKGIHFTNKTDKGRRHSSSRTNMKDEPSNSKNRRKKKTKTIPKNRTLKGHSDITHEMGYVKAENMEEDISSVCTKDTTLTSDDNNQDTQVDKKNQENIPEKMRGTTSPSKIMEKQKFRKLNRKTRTLYDPQHELFVNCPLEITRNAAGAKEQEENKILATEQERKNEEKAEGSENTKMNVISHEEVTVTPYILLEKLSTCDENITSKGDKKPARLKRKRLENETPVKPSQTSSDNNLFDGIKEDIKHRKKNNEQNLDKVVKVVADSKKLGIDSKSKHQRRNHSNRNLEELNIEVANQEINEPKISSQILKNVKENSNEIEKINSVPSEEHLTYSLKVSTASEVKMFESTFDHATLKVSGVNEEISLSKKEPDISVISTKKNINIVSSEGQLSCSSNISTDLGITLAGISDDTVLTDSEVEGRNLGEKESDISVIPKQMTEEDVDANSADISVHSSVLDVKEKNILFEIENQSVDNGSDCITQNEVCTEMEVTTDDISKSSVALRNSPEYFVQIDDINYRDKKVDTYEKPSDYIQSLCLKLEDITLRSGKNDEKNKNSDVSKDGKRSPELENPKIFDSKLYKLKDTNNSTSGTYKMATDSCTSKNPYPFIVDSEVDNTLKMELPVCEQVYSIDNKNLTTTTSELLLTADDNLETAEQVSPNECTSVSDMQLQKDLSIGTIVETEIQVYTASKEIDDSTDDSDLLSNVDDHLDEVKDKDLSIGIKTVTETPEPENIFAGDTENEELENSQLQQEFENHYKDDFSAGEISETTYKDLSIGEMIVTETPEAKKIQSGNTENEQTKVPQLQQEFDNHSQGEFSAGQISETKNKDLSIGNISVTEPEKILTDDSENEELKNLQLQQEFENQSEDDFSTGQINETTNKDLSIGNMIVTETSEPVKYFDDDTENEQTNVSQLQQGFGNHSKDDVSAGQITETNINLLEEVSSDEKNAKSECDSELLLESDGHIKNSLNEVLPTGNITKSEISLSELVSPYEETGISTSVSQLQTKEDDPSKHAISEVLIVDNIIDTEILVSELVSSNETDVESTRGPQLQLKADAQSEDVINEDLSSGNIIETEIHKSEQNSSITEEKESRRDSAADRSDISKITHFKEHIVQEILDNELQANRTPKDKEHECANSKEKNSSQASDLTNPPLAEQTNVAEIMLSEQKQDTPQQVNDSTNPPLAEQTIVAKIILSEQKPDIPQKITPQQTPVVCSTNQVSEFSNNKRKLTEGQAEMEDVIVKKRCFTQEIQNEIVSPSLLDMNNLGELSRFSTETKQQAIQNVKHSHSLVDNKVLLNECKVSRSAEKLISSDDASNNSILIEDNLKMSIDTEEENSVRLPESQPLESRNNSCLTEVESISSSDYQLTQSSNDTECSTCSNEMKEESQNILDLSFHEKTVISTERNVSKPIQLPSSNMSSCQEPLEIQTLNSSKNELSFSIERMLQPSPRHQQKGICDNSQSEVSNEISEQLNSCSRSGKQNVEIIQMSNEKSETFKHPGTSNHDNLILEKNKIVIDGENENTKKHNMKEKVDSIFKAEENCKVIVERVYSMDELAGGTPISSCLNFCSAPILPISTELIPYRYGVYSTVIPSVERNDEKDSRFNAGNEKSIKSSKTDCEILSQNRDVLPEPQKRTLYETTSRKEEGIPISQKGTKSSLDNGKIAESKIVEPSLNEITVPDISENDIEIVQVEGQEDCQSKNHRMKNPEDLNMHRSKSDKDNELLNTNDEPQQSQITSPTSLSNKTILKEIEQFDNIVKGVKISLSSEGIVQSDKSSGNDCITDTAMTEGNELKIKQPVNSIDSIIMSGLESETKVNKSESDSNIQPLQLEILNTNIQTSSNTVNEFTPSQKVNVDQATPYDQKVIDQEQNVQAESTEMEPSTNPPYVIEEVSSVSRVKFDNTSNEPCKYPNDSILQSQEMETSKATFPQTEVSPKFTNNVEQQELSENFVEKVVQSPSSKGMESLLTSFQSAITDTIAQNISSLQGSFSLFSDNSDNNMEFPQQNEVRNEEILQVNFQEKSSLPVNQPQVFINNRLNLPQSTPIRSQEIQQADDSLFNMSDDIFDFDFNSVNQTPAGSTYSNSYVNTTMSSENLQMIFDNPTEFLHLLCNLNDVGCEVTVDDTNVDDIVAKPAEYIASELIQEQLIDAIPPFITEEEFDSNVPTDPMVGGQKELVPDPKQDSNLDEVPFPESALSFDEEMMHRYALFLHCDVNTTEQSSTTEGLNQMKSFEAESSAEALKSRQKPENIMMDQKMLNNYGERMTTGERKSLTESSAVQITENLPDTNATLEIKKQTEITVSNTQETVKKSCSSSPKTLSPNSSQDINKYTNKIVEKNPVKVQKIPASKYAPPKKNKNNETQKNKKQQEKADVEQTKHSINKEKNKSLTLDLDFNNSLDMPQLFSPGENTSCKSKSIKSTHKSKVETKASISEKQEVSVDKKLEKLSEDDDSPQMQYNMYDRTKAMKRNAAMVENYCKFYDDGSSSSNKNKKRKSSSKVESGNHSSSPNIKEKCSGSRDSPKEFETQSKKLKIAELPVEVPKKNAIPRLELRDSIPREVKNTYVRDLNAEFDKLKNSGPYKSSPSRNIKYNRTDRILRSAQEGSGSHYQMPSSSQYSYIDRGKREDRMKREVADYRKTEDLRRKAKVQERSRSPHSRSSIHPSTMTDHRRESFRRSKLMEMKRNDGWYDSYTTSDDRRRTSEGHHSRDLHRKVDRYKTFSSRSHSNQSQQKSDSKNGDELWKKFDEMWPLETDVYKNTGYTKRNE